MRLVLAICLALALQPGAFALSGGGGGGGGSSSGGHGSSSSGTGNRILMLFNRTGDDADQAEEEPESSADDDPRVFTLPALVVPLSSDGRLTGFAYVHVRVRAADGQNIWTMQENAHYALDALVRAAYRIPVSTPDGRSLDRERAAAEWTAVLRELYGSRAVERIEIRSADTRLLNR